MYEKVETVYLCCTLEGEASGVQGVVLEISSLLMKED